MPELRGKRVTDERLKRIKDLSRLRSLSLLDTSVTDDGLLFLAEAMSLREISISSTVLTDACMETLCALPALVSLLIHNAPLITDQGIGHLQQRESLRELYLDGTHLTDRGIPSFTHLESIWSLCLRRNLRLLSLKETRVAGYGLCDLPTPPTSIYLDGCPVTDDAVMRIANHVPGLRTLSLKDTPVSDDCLAALSTLTRLETLRLTGTQVTDTGVAHFRGHPSLYTLEVCETHVSEEEKTRLKAESPHVGMTVIR
jgi:hypothetical protein